MKHAPKPLSPDRKSVKPGTQRVTFGEFEDEEGWKCGCSFCLDLGRTFRRKYTGNDDELGVSEETPVVALPWPSHEPALPTQQPQPRRFVPNRFLPVYWRLNVAAQASPRQKCKQPHFFSPSFPDSSNSPKRDSS